MFGISKHFNISELNRMVATLDSSVDSREASCFSPQDSETTNDTNPMNDIGIHEFYELIGEHPPESATEEQDGRHTSGKNRKRPRPQNKTSEQTNSRVKGQEKKRGPAFGTFKAFMDVLESCLKGLKKNELEICQRSDYTPSGHRRTTKAKPEVIIVRRDHLPSLKEEKTYWGSIEMAIEYQSAGKSREERLKQVVSYVACLLEGRLDLVSALGLLVEGASLVFFFCNAKEIKKLSLSRKEDYLPLLSAVMRYLNGGQRKNLDPTLSRAPDSVLFDVSVPGAPATFASCQLRYSHDPFGRRSSVFIYEPKNEVSVIRVIKDQYIKKNRHWTEKDILDKIHRNGTYPAVVRMCFCGEITQAACGDHIRVRMCLQDYGTDFLSLKTPRDVIYALYDLLEVTRSLYFDRKILHRDISPNNIMIRDSRYTQDLDTCSSASPVFIRHLLNAEVPKHKSSIFLIDFGYSQDLESIERRSEGRVGTPMFIARAVQVGKPLREDIAMIFPDLPPLSEGIKGAYRSAYPERVIAFNEPLGRQIGPCTNPPSSPFQHKLEHDGESGVWCSFWWSILAFPENAVQVPINPTYWTALMPRYEGSRMELPLADVRDTNLHALIDQAETMFNPGYEGLRDLFGSIARAILPDYHWAEGTIRQRPDFVHEILQRIILNFVVKNENATFMDQKKADRNRSYITLFGGTRNFPSSTYKSDSCRSESSLASSSSSQSFKHKLKETNTDPTPPIPAMTPASCDADEFGDNQSDCYDEEDIQPFAKKCRTNEGPVTVIDAGTERLS